MMTKEEYKDKSQQNVNEALSKVVKAFETGQVSTLLTKITFPQFDSPSSNWSLGNQLILLFSGGSDGRGYRQWEKVGRHVKSGQHATYILAPLLKTITKKETKDDGTEEETTIKILTGFKGVPVFDVSQTEGKPVEYTKVELPENLPLLDKAKEWGITVQGKCSYHGELGTYHQVSEWKEGDKEKINVVPTNDEATNFLTFLHELSHAAHRRVKGKLEGGQDTRQEAAAELAAQVLQTILNPEAAAKTEGRAYEYLQSYAKGSKKSVGQLCLEVVGDVEKILNLILGREKKEEKEE